MSEPEYGYVLIEFYGRAHYDSHGDLERVEVCVNGTTAVVAFPGPEEGIGECFARAFDRSMVLMLTRSVLPEKKCAKCGGPFLDGQARSYSDIDKTDSHVICPEEPAGEP